MNSTWIPDLPRSFEAQPKVVIWLFSFVLLISFLLISLPFIIFCCIKRRRTHSYRVSYHAPVVSSSHNFEGGTIRLTRHFDHSLLNESARFHTLPRHSIVRLPNSDTLIEYEEEGPEASL